MRIAPPLRAILFFFRRLLAQLQGARLGGSGDAREWQRPWSDTYNNNETENAGASMHNINNNNNPSAQAAAGRTDIRIVRIEIITDSDSGLEDEEVTDEQNVIMMDAQQQRQQRDEQQPQEEPQQQGDDQRWIEVAEEHLRLQNMDEGHLARIMARLRGADGRPAWTYSEYLGFRRSAIAATSR